MADVHISLTSPGIHLVLDLRSELPGALKSSRKTRIAGVGQEITITLPPLIAIFCAVATARRLRQPLRGNRAPRPYDLAYLRTFRPAPLSTPSSAVSLPYCPAHASRAMPPAASHVPRVAQKCSDS